MIRSIAVLALTSSVAFAQLGPLAPPAGAPADTGPSLDQIDGRIPLDPADAGSSVGFTISTPGSYYLTGNLTFRGTAIRVSTDGDVRLDLNGYTVTSTTTSATQAAIVVGTNTGTLEIFDGSIVGGGIGLTGAESAIVMRRVVVRDQLDDGAIIGSDSVIESCRFENTPGSAISATSSLFGNRVTVRDTNIVNADIGINLVNRVSIERVTIENTPDAVFLAADARVSDLIVRDALNTALSTTDGAIVTGLRASGIGNPTAPFNPVRLGDNCLIKDSVIDEMRGETFVMRLGDNSVGDGLLLNLNNTTLVSGISMGSRCELRDCAVHGAEVDGVVGGNICVIKNCVIDTGTTFQNAIRVAAQSLVESNRVSGAVSVGLNSSVIRCKISGTATANPSGFIAPFNDPTTGLSNFF